MIGTDDRHTREIDNAHIHEPVRRECFLSGVAIISVKGRDENVSAPHLFLQP